MVNDTLNQVQIEELNAVLDARQIAMSVLLYEGASVIIDDVLKKYPSKLTIQQASRIKEKVLKDYLSNLNKGGSMCVERVIYSVKGHPELVGVTDKKIFVAWLDDQTKEMSNNILKIFAENQKAGIYPLDTARQLKDYFEGTRHRAITAARTESTKIRADSRQQAQKELGTNYVVWQTAGDDRVRPDHAIRDGKIYKIDEAPALGDYNCRCTLAPADYRVKQGAKVEDTNIVILRRDEIQ